MILLNLWIEIYHSGGSATGPVGCGESASELGCSGESAVRPSASVKSVPASGAFGKLAVRSVTLNLQQDQIGV